MSLRRSNSKTRKWRVPLAVRFAALSRVWRRNAPAILHLNNHPLQSFGEPAPVSLPWCHVLPPAATVGGVSGRPGTPRHRLDWLAVDTHALPTVEYRAWWNVITPPAG